MKANIKNPLGVKNNSIMKVLCLALLCLLSLPIGIEARQLFYILDSVGQHFPDYQYIVKCYDLNGVYQYEFFLADPPGSGGYGALATDGYTVWLASKEPEGIHSFAIRLGGLDGIHIPLQTGDPPTHGGTIGLAIKDNGLWLSRAYIYYAWPQDNYGRIEVYDISSRSYVGKIDTDAVGLYPNSLQMVGDTLLIGDSKHPNVYSLNTSSWELSDPLPLTGWSYGTHQLCANSNYI